MKLFLKTKLYDDYLQEFTKIWCKNNDGPSAWWRGFTHAGLWGRQKDLLFQKEQPCDVVAELKKHKVDVLINYMPVGSEKEGLTKFCAEAVHLKQVSFVNCMPVFIASDEKWAKKFQDKGIPIVGDDIKSQPQRHNCA